MNENINIEYVRELPKEEWAPFEDDGSYQGTRNVEVISVFVKNHLARFVIKQGITIKSNSEIPFIDVRQWYLQEETGKWRAGKQGIRMTPSQWSLFQSILYKNKIILAMDLSREEPTNHTGYINSEIDDAINRNATKKPQIIRNN